VLSATGEPGKPIEPPIRYHLPTAATLNVITDLTPTTTYTITTTPDPTGLIINITPGPGPHTTQAGILNFTTH
jgi:hypothetical protein